MQLLISRPGLPNHPTGKGTRKPSKKLRSAGNESVNLRAFQIRSNEMVEATTDRALFNGSDFL